MHGSVVAILLEYSQHHLQRYPRASDNQKNRWQDIWTHSGEAVWYLGDSPQSRAEDRILPYITSVSSCVSTRIWTWTFLNSWYFLLHIAHHLKWNDCHILSSILVLCSISLAKYNGLLDNFNNFNIYWIFTVLEFKLRPSCMQDNLSTNGAT